MNHELAKQLKDAGFPQTPTKDFWSHYYDEKGNIVSLSFIPEPLLGGTPGQPKPGGHHYKIPILEELIEECGGRPFFLECTDGSWWAECWDGDARKRLAQEKGSTPTEAVAKLWLALNPKKV